MKARDRVSWIWSSKDKDELSARAGRTGKIKGLQIIFVPLFLPLNFYRDSGLFPI